MLDYSMSLEFEEEPTYGALMVIWAGLVGKLEEGNRIGLDEEVVWRWLS